MMNSITRSTWGRRPLAALLLGLLALTALLSASPATASSVAQQSPPGRVDSVSVTRADGSMTASWNAPTGATKYHITYSADYGASWSLGAFGHTSTSLTIAVDNPKTYIVGVRAGNDAGWGAWRNSSTVGPFVPTKPPPPPAPGTTSSVSTTRADGTLTASWPAVAHAETYHITYSSDAKHSWTLAAFDHTTTSITISVDNDKTYVVGVRAKNMSGAGGWRNSPPAGAFKNAPAAPTGLSVTPGDGYYDIAWSAVAAATGYDIRAKTSGSSTWHSVANGLTGTSHRYTTAQTLDRIAVRARNAGGASAWTEISRSPSNEWLTTVQQFGGASLQMAQSQAQAQSTKLTAPTLGTITRDNGTRETGSDQSITVNWTAVTGATGYNVVCSATDGWSWWQCGAITSGSTTTLKVDNGPNGNDLSPNRSYKVAVRAVNSTPADASDWTNSVNIRPVNGKLLNLTATRGNGTITLSWTPTAWTTGYLVDCAVADMTPPYSPSVYTRCATLSNQSDTASSHSVTISSWTAGGTSYSIDNTKTYDIKITSTNQWGRAEWLVPLVAPLRLSASSVGLTSATLNLPSSYTAAWWYKRTAPTAGTCESVSAGTTSADLSSLTSGQNYTYKAYSATGCNSGDEIASASFSTGANVGNLSAASDGFGIEFHSGYYQGVGFTTGDNAGGYTLQSVTARFLDASRNPTGFAATIRLPGAGGVPSGSPLYTLSSPTNPTTAGQHTFTCSESCQLNASTKYFLVMTSGSSSTNRYKWDTTTDTAETNAPSNFGWTIDDQSRTNTNGTWATAAWVGVFRVNASKNRTLAASGVIANQATLSITNYNGIWYYKADNAPHTSCQGPIGGTTATLRNLVKGASYVYSAYSDAECRAENLLVTAPSFTTPSFLVTGLGTTGATLTLNNWSLSLWYKADSGPHSTCQTHSGRGPIYLDGLTEGTSYVYKAYSATGCSEDNYITDVFFTTTQVRLTASNISDTAATLNLSGHSGDWYYQADTGPHTSCSSAQSGTTADLSGLTSGTTYTYKAYSDSTCTTANEVAAATPFTTGASYATNLYSAKTGQSLISNNATQAVAFTTGASANGYTLSSVTLPLRALDSDGNLTVTLRQMQGTGTYGTSSAPSSTVLATLTGTTPSSSTWADTTFTCSGAGCSLSANTTYFVVAVSDRLNSHAWAVATTNSESTYPANSGWDIGYGHDNEGGRGWFSAGDYHPVQAVFTTVPLPALSAGSIGATNAVLTIANHTGAWYYKANAGPHTSCSSAQSGTTATLSGLTAGTTYTYKAYSDSACTTANLLATATAFTTAITVSNLSATTSATLFSLGSDPYAQEFTTGSATNGYTLKSVTLDFTAVTNASNIAVSLRAQESSSPAATDLVTLTGTPADGQVTFNCSGASCNLSASTDYYVVVRRTSGFTNAGHLRTTTSDNETLQPSTNGWSIANLAVYQQGNWIDEPASHSMKLELEAVAR